VSNISSSNNIGNVSSGPQSLQQFRDSLSTDVSYHARLALQFKVMQPLFEKAINQVLDEYGLAEKLSQAKQRGQVLRLLQLHCGEGLYLHELARLLETRGLLAAAQLNGIEEDQTQITTADEYRNLASPPRPYLNFYCHKLQQPLEECVGLRQGLGASGATRFDFIFGGFNALSLTKNARVVVERIYRQNLKDGANLMFIEGVRREGPVGWRVPHPGMAKVVRTLHQIGASYNPGSEDIGTDTARWLGKLDAGPVSSYRALTPWGGPTEPGRIQLLNMLAIIRISGPEMVKVGLITPQEYDDFIQIIYKELTPHHLGQYTFTVTLAAKPVARSEEKTGPVPMT
jgi:hypothetical protein